MHTFSEHLLENPARYIYIYGDFCREFEKCEQNMRMFNLVIVNYWQHWIDCAPALGRAVLHTAHTPNSKKVDLQQ